MATGKADREDRCTAAEKIEKEVELHKKDNTAVLKKANR